MTPHFLDPDAPYDTPPREIGPDGLTDDQRIANHLAWRLLAPLSVFLVALVLVFFVLFEHSVVSGPSMQPTLYSGDRILTTRGLATPKRGDVVVLNVTEGGKPAEWVKRIVALAGDHVHVEGDYVLVNGQPEAFHHRIVAFSEYGPAQDLVVPAGHVFVMGDDRPVSFDSRDIGPLPVSAIRGRVVAIFAPLNRIGLLPAP